MKNLSLHILAEDGSFSLTGGQTADWKLGDIHLGTTCCHEGSGLSISRGRRFDLKLCHVADRVRDDRFKNSRLGQPTRATGKTHPGPHKRHSQSGRRVSATPQVVGVSVLGNVPQCHRSGDQNTALSSLAALGVQTENKGSAGPCAFQRFQGRVLPCLS